MNESLTFMQAVANFHFLRPLWLLALIPALFFFRRLWILESSSTAWQKVIDQSLLPYLLKASRQASKRLPLYLLLAIWVASIIALSGPTWKQQPAPVQQRQDALVVVLDLSVPMFATDEEPNRLTVARRKVLDLLNQRIEGQTGLVVYSGEAHMVTPLTDDSISIRAMVPALTPNIMPVRGNNPAQALQMAVDLLNESSIRNGRILLLSSGIPVDGNQAITDVMSTAPYPLNIIGVGSESGATIPTANGQVLRNNSGQPVIVQMDRSNLQRIADSAGGLYHDITLDDEDLNYVLDESRLANSMDDYQAAEDEIALWEDAGPWLILLVLPLAALSFRRGWVMQLALTCGAAWLALAVVPGQPALAQEPGAESPTAEATASSTGEESEIDLTDPLANPALREQLSPNNLDVGEGMQIQTIGNVPSEASGEPEEDPGFQLRDFFLNREQRAMEALNEGRPAQASQLFEDREWRGTAHYRAGNYAAAIADFSESDDIESLYNLGNALAFAERLQESIAAYSRVLELNPQHQDAAHNKAIVEDLLEQQEQQEQQEQEQQEEEEQQESAEAESEENEDENEPQLEQDQQEQEQQDEQDPQEQETQEQEQQDAETDSSQKNQRSQNSEFEEDQESLEQFLRRIEDDPGELLQRKFQFESRRRMMERRAAEQGAR
jgi:Ca-activated chloride channel family protein